jgi:hypothetical protein
MRKFLIALAAGTVIGLAPMFAEQAEAQMRGGFGGGIGRVGVGPGIGRVGVGPGIGRVGVGPGIGRVGVGPVGPGFVGRSAFVGRPGFVGRSAFVGRPGFIGRHAFVHRPFFPGRRFAVAPFFGVGLLAAGYGYSSCWTWVPTYFGWQRVWVCGDPYGYGYGGYY